MYPDWRRALLLIWLAAAGVLCSGCIVSLTNIQYAVADPAPLGWVTTEVRPAPWCALIDDEGDDADPSGSLLVVPTAAVQRWPLPIVGPEPIGVRFVVLALDADALPPDAIALPAVAGLTAGELERWVAALTPAQRDELVARARAARDGIVARREPPAPMAERDWSEYVRARHTPEEPLPPSDSAVDVIRLTDDAFIVAYRRPGETGAETHLVGHNIPPPQPPPTGPPNPAPYHAAVVLPMSFETSGGDRAARAATAAVVSPAALACDAAIVGFSLLPLAITVGVVALVV